MSQFSVDGNMSNISSLSCGDRWAIKLNQFHTGLSVPGCLQVAGAGKEIPHCCAMDGRTKAAEVKLKNVYLLILVCCFGGSVLPENLVEIALRPETCYTY